MLPTYHLLREPETTIDKTKKTVDEHMDGILFAIFFRAETEVAQNGGE